MTPVAQHRVPPPPAPRHRQRERTKANTLGARAKSNNMTMDEMMKMQQAMLAASKARMAAAQAPPQ